MTEPQAPSTGDTVCYRHPNRPTGLRCVNCDRPICGGCSTPGSVGQFCPDCARQRGRQRIIAARPGTATRLRRGAPITFGILAVTIAGFVITQFAGELGDRVLFELAQFNQLVALGEWWRLFTPILLHASIAHILFNMYALFQLGPAVEARYGRAPFLALYLGAAGVGGAFAFHFGGPEDVLVGASGAVFGLFGLWLHAAYKMRDTAFGRNLLSSLWISLLLNIALPFLIPGISWQGHLGGLLAGILTGEIWSRIRARQRVLVPVGLVILAVLSVLL
ncbi:MAG TPA: rhomboid family intramembrane serine protease [Acidimicrobiia bacterium]|nr:rhomboid family intramembrane serine protease [Acidimicrobiia bacterium]